jgi:uncharacterized repeat protein (TIGR03803 family)
MTKAIVCRLLHAVIIFLVAMMLSGISLAQVNEQVIFDFPGSGAEGYDPNTRLVYRSGRFFGTTTAGGGEQCNCGVVFSLTPTKGGGWTYRVLHAFMGEADGYDPSDDIVFDASGNLYGTTQEGGNSFLGTVYELSPNANGTWAYKIIYSFTGSPDAVLPAGLVIDAAGNLYGSGLGGGVFERGAIFDLTPIAGGAWSESVVYSFGGPGDGSDPNDGLSLDSAGNLYGTTFRGGTNNLGTVFELSPSSAGGWIETTLLSSTTNMGNPVSIMVDPAGHVYGTSFPSQNTPNLGTVFDLTRNSDGTWTSNILHTFVNAKGGQLPRGTLILDTNGNLVGTTQFGGASGAGTVYKLSPGSGGAWNFRRVHSFADGPTDGGAPTVGVTLVNRGIFGTTVSGGAVGVIYEIKF